MNLVNTTNTDIDGENAYNDDKSINQQKHKLFQEIIGDTWITGLKRNTRNNGDI